MASPSGVESPAEQIVELKRAEPSEGWAMVESATSRWAGLRLRVSLLEVEELQGIADTAKLQEVTHGLACGTGWPKLITPQQGAVQGKHFDGEATIWHS
jgi:hypothetical protein